METRRQARIRKHLRVRKKIKGTSERPRLSVYRSLNHVYAQIIDDTNHCTLMAASTLDDSIRKVLQSTSSKNAAKEVGKLIAKRAINKDIKKVVFDRGGYLYHGIIKELAEAAREEGLEF